MAFSPDYSRRFLPSLLIRPVHSDLHRAAEGRTCASLPWSEDVRHAHANARH